MGIFYNPPQPPTANNAGTPPEPHIPIGAQGTSVPPSRARAFAVTMAILVAAWPADLEPRLTRPNDQQTKIAPLTLAYGQQPRPQPFLTTVELHQIVASWPTDVGPLLARPNAEQQKIAPLTRTYGAQPPPIPALAIAELAPIVASWQETWGAQRAPKSLAWLAPLSPYVPDTPLPSLIWSAWVEPPPQPPRPVALAPLTLPYGAQPTPQPPLSTLELDQIHRTWIETWSAQTALESAAWDVPPVVQGFVPAVRVRYDILAINQDPVTIAFVESYVASQSSTDEPPRQGALSLANQAITLQAWTPAVVTPPAPRPTAAWNIPPLIVASVPSVGPPTLILLAWQPDLIRLPRLVTIAPLTLPTWSQPPVQFPLSAAGRIILQTWPADLEPRLGRPNAERPRNAPLTLTYGSQPVPRGPLSSAQLSVFAWAWVPAFVAPPPLATFGQGIPFVSLSGADLALSDAVVTALALTDSAVTVLTVDDVLLIAAP